jgi:hypothetical protein
MTEKETRVPVEAGEEGISVEIGAGKLGHFH